LTATAQRHSAPTTTHLQRVCDPWLQTKVRKPYSEIKQRSNSVDEHVPQTVPEEKTVTYTSVSLCEVTLHLCCACALLCVWRTCLLVAGLAYDPDPPSKFRIHNTINGE
jgi:hypothetical protein